MPTEIARKDAEQRGRRKLKDRPLRTGDDSMRDNEVLPANGSAEIVAYRLMLHVMEAEGRALTGPKAVDAKVNRNVILDAYADCLDAVKGSRPRRAQRLAAISS
jgi:hypothetical protein